MGLREPLCFHVERVTVDGQEKNQCIHCGYQLSAKQDSPTRWAEHLVACRDCPIDDKLLIAQNCKSDRMTKLVEKHLGVESVVNTTQKDTKPAISALSRTAIQTQTPNKRQCTVTKFADNCDSDRAKRIMSKTTAFVVENGLCFNIVDSPSFKELVNELNVAFKPQSSRAFIRHEMPEFHKKIHGELEEMMNRLPEKYLTLGIDGFVNDASRHVYIVTIAKADKVMCVCCIEETNSQQNAIELAQVIDSVLKEKAGGKSVEEAFAGVVFDNSKVNPAAGRIIQQSYPKLFTAGCRAHAAYLLMEDIGNIPQIKSVVDRAVSMANFVKYHNQIQAAYSDMKKKMSGATSQKTFPTTRFASCDVTLQHVVGEGSVNFKIMRKLVYDANWGNWTSGISADLVSEFKRNVEDVEFIERLEIVRRLTSSVSVFIQHIERPGARASWILPLFEDLREALLAWMNDPETIRRGMFDIGQEIMAIFNNRYNGTGGKDPIYHKELLLATILDPYTSVGKSVLDVMEPNWIGHATSVFESFFSGDRMKVHLADMELSKLVESVQTGSGAFGENASSFQEILETAVGEIADSVSDPVSDLARRVELQKASIMFSPVSFWSTRYRDEYPTLFEIAERLVPLAIQSADVERCCNVSKLIHTKTRDRLENPKVVQLIGCYANARLLRRLKVKPKLSQNGGTKEVDDSAMLWSVDGSPDNIIDELEHLDSDDE